MYSNRILKILNMTADIISNQLNESGSNSNPENKGYTNLENTRHQSANNSSSITENIISLENYKQVDVSLLNFDMSATNECWNFENIDLSIIRL